MCVCVGGVLILLGLYHQVTHPACPEEEVLILGNCSWLPILTLQDKAKEGFEDTVLSDKSLSPGTRPWPVRFLLTIWSFQSLITIKSVLCVQTLEMAARLVPLG